MRPADLPLDRRVRAVVLPGAAVPLSIPLYRPAADAGDGYDARRLADLLAKHGDLGELCAPSTPAMAGGGGR